MMREKNTQENDKNENTEGDTDLSMQNENEQVNNRNQSEPRTLMRIEQAGLKIELSYLFKTSVSAESRTFNH